MKRKYSVADIIFVCLFFCINFSAFLSGINYIATNPVSSPLAYIAILINAVLSATWIMGFIHMFKNRLDKR